MSSLVLKYWYSEPTLIPASRATRLTFVPAYPWWAKAFFAASITRRRFCSGIRSKVGVHRFVGSFRFTVVPSGMSAHSSIAGYPFSRGL